MNDERMTTHPGGAFEMMAERSPCGGACDVCDLFGEMSPERLARIADAARSATSLIGANQYTVARAS